MQTIPSAGGGFRLLFVCTGNTCRSPMAAVIARREAAELGLQGFEVRSAGVGAFEGDRASGGAVRAAARNGLDLSQHGATQLTAELVEWDEANGLVKLNPLVAWPDARVRNYLHEHDLPYNPLHDKGYTSVGCRPCTRAVLPGEDVRAGRWAGFAKTECGIHVSGPLQLGDSGVS